MGSLFARSGESRNLVDEVRRIDVMAWGHARGAVVNDSTPARGAHQGNRGGNRMGAALGAARNVDRNGVALSVQDGIKDRGERRRERTRREQPRGAGGSAWACGDASSGVTGTRHEAKAFCERR